MNLSVDNSVLYQIAFQLGRILLVMLVAGFIFGIVSKVIKAPQWLLKPFITLGVLVGMYFIFQILY